MAFLNDLSVIILDNGDAVLIDKLMYQVRHSDRVIVIPKGFTTDFASIAKVLRSLVPGTKIRREATLHDYLYRRGIGTRSQADRIFEQAMRDNGVGWLKRHAIWLAVRVGGWASWKG